MASEAKFKQPSDDAMVLIKEVTLMNRWIVQQLLDPYVEKDDGKIDWLGILKDGKGKP